MNPQNEDQIRREMDELGIGLSRDPQQPTLPGGVREALTEAFRPYTWYKNELDINSAVDRILTALAPFLSTHFSPASGASRSNADTHREANYEDRLAVAGTAPVAFSPQAQARELANAITRQQHPEICTGLSDDQIDFYRHRDVIAALLAPTLEALHEQITTLEQRHAAVMLHTQGVVDENTTLRNSGEGLKEAVTRTLDAVVTERDGIVGEPLAFRDTNLHFSHVEAMHTALATWSVAVRGNGGAP